MVVDGKEISISRKLNAEDISSQSEFDEPIHQGFYDMFDISSLKYLLKDKLETSPSIRYQLGKKLSYSVASLNECYSY